jgi:hypothetical protein
LRDAKYYIATLYQVVFVGVTQQGKKMFLPTQPACNRATTLAGPEYQQNNMVLFIIFSLLVYRFKTQQICNINLKGFYVLDSLFMNDYAFFLA